MFGNIAIEYLLKNYKFNTLLDIGSGDGKHSEIFRNNKKEVTEIDLGSSYYAKQRKGNKIVSSNYLNIHFDKAFDAIWMCHVLEHQPNPNIFLQKANKDLKENGILAVTVPPLKNQIVGGHVTLWNAGILLYQLILAGFDCSEAAIKKYQYNISIILKKKSIKIPSLTSDYGDIDKLSNYFPNSLNTGFRNPADKSKLEGFNGDINNLNWKE